MNAQANPHATWEENFVAHMRRLRESGGMTQTDLARVLKAKFGLATFHQQTIQRLEASERPVRLDEAYLIARALDVDLETMTTHINSSDRDLLYSVDRVRSRVRALHHHLGELMGDLVESLDELTSLELERDQDDEVTHAAWVWSTHPFQLFVSLKRARDLAREVSSETEEPEWYDSFVDKVLPHNDEVSTPDEDYQRLLDSAREVD